MNLTSKAKFSVLCKVSKPAITKAVSIGKLDAVNGKIDIDSDKAVKYMMAHDAVIGKPEQVNESRLTHDETLTDADDFSLEKLEKLEKFEKVKKLQIDNAIKLKQVVSKKIVDLMTDKVDEVLNRIILDGRASFIPKLCKKVRAGGTDEELALFWNDEITKYISPAKSFMVRIIKKFERDKE